MGNYNFPSRGKSSEKDEVLNDSIWAKVGALARSLSVTPDYLLHEMSYANAMLYNASTPGLDDEKETGTINADDPKNKELIRKILFDNG